MSPYVVCLLSIPLLLGMVVILRMLYTAGQAAKAKLGKNSRKNTRGLETVALLDEPFPCPTCERLNHVHVARADFQEMPYVEHFVCHGCGTQFLGPNQEKMVEKRLAAREKIASIMKGRAQYKEKWWKK